MARRLSTHTQTINNAIDQGDVKMNFNISEILFLNSSSQTLNENSEGEECSFFEIAHKYYIPLILVMGLVGNFLSGIVFLTTHLNMKSSSYYLAALSSADFGFLTMLLLVYLSNETRLELFNRNGWCQWLIYLSSSCSILSVWLIVAFTVERFIAVQYPLQRPRMCTVSRAKLIIIVISITALASQTYLFITAGMVRPRTRNITMPNDLSEAVPSESSSEREYCGMRPEYYHFMRVITLIDTIVSLICPVVLIIVMNSMIARNLFLFRRRFVRHDTMADCWVYSRKGSVAGQNAAGQLEENKLRNTNKRNSSNRSSEQSKHSANIAPPSTRSARSVKICGSEEQLPICSQINTTASRNAMSVKGQQSITKTLLLISTVFILLNLPSYAIRIYIFFFFSLWNQNAPPILWCMQQSSMMLYYTNFSVNFLLYSVCGETFRRCLAQLLRKYFNAFRNFGRIWCKLIPKHSDPQRSTNEEALATLRQ